MTATIRATPAPSVSLTRRATGATGVAVPATGPGRCAGAMSPRPAPLTGGATRRAGRATARPDTASDTAVTRRRGSATARLVHSQLGGRIIRHPSTPSVYLSSCHLVCLPIPPPYLSIILSPLHPVCLSVCLSFRHPACLAILSPRPFIIPSLHPSVTPSVRTSLQPVCLSSR